MLKLFFLILVTVHGLIHLMGFVKGFNLADMTQLSLPISKEAGIVWLTTSILFLVTLVMLLTNFDYWYVAGILAILLSQYLIIQNWGDAKFGTIANFIIVIPVFLAFMESLPSSYQNTYKAEVENRLSNPRDDSVLTEQDLTPLPEPVQKYLRYTGSVGKPKIYNFRAIASGSMKQSPEKDWMDIKAQQYNFFNDPARLFYIKAEMFSIPFDGLHAYVGNSATMNIKVASLLQVVEAKGPKMNQSENVTMFNDMCVLAPGSLTSKLIQWEAVDSTTAKAKYTNNNITISATLFFNENGELINFISDDRFESSDGKTYNNYRWETPIKNYREFEGRKIAVYGEAIWKKPEGDYTYGKFTIDKIEYNTGTFSLAHF